MKKKIIIKGPALSQTGYGEQTRFALRALRSRPDLFDLYLLNLEWGKSNHIIEDNEEHSWLVKLLQKTGHYVQSSNGSPQFDLSLQVTIPNEFEKMAPVNVGYTAGIESTKVAPQWLQKTNEIMDRLIVISNHAKHTFSNTVVEAQDHMGNKFPYQLQKPIEVVNYPVRPQNPSPLELDLPHDFNYLVVGQWGPRKNLENTIRWFVEENIDREVGLVLKTNCYKNCNIDRAFTQSRLNHLLAVYPDRKCSVTLLHGYMSEEQMQGLYRHEKIKAYVSITHGEGFGLPLFDAAIAGLPIITVPWSGHCDFLYVPYKDKKGKTKQKSHFLKVEYNIQPIQAEAIWDGVLEKDSQWAFAKEGSYKMALRKMKNDYHVYQGMAKKLSKWVLENFTEENQYHAFVTHTYGEEVKNDWSSVSTDELPKISIITSVYDGDEFIEPFLEDITSQTIFEDKCELILINAASPGNEEEIISKYVEKYPNNIVYKKLDEDPGIYGVWNMAVEMSTGDFLTNANLDDRKAPNSLEAHAKTLFANEEVELVYADSYITNKPNETFLNNSSQERRYNFEEFSKEGMLRGNLPHNNPMWRKTLHTNHGTFDDSYRSAGDWEFWLRCANAGSIFKKLPGIYGLYYFNPKGISTNFENFSWKQEEETRVYEKYKPAVAA
jgi:hypothetical protein